MGLKEADAFQRLVFRQPSCLGVALRRLKEADAFQRLVCEIHMANDVQRQASKKQTPFSVWYP